MSLHRVYCAVHDPTPGQCDCGAPTNYELGVRDGVRMCACAICPKCRAGKRPEPDGGLYWHDGTECAAWQFWALLR